MIGTYDVKENMRHSDKMLHLLNYMSELKNKGVPLKGVLSNIIDNFGEVYSNLVRNGRVNEENIDSCRTYLTTLTGENSDKYFSNEHENLSVSAKGALENIDMAEVVLEERRQFAEPVIEQSSYDSGFKKLGLKS